MSAEQSGEHSPAQKVDGQIQGLSAIPDAWPELSANPTTIKELIDGDNLAVYMPVDRLIDNTPFQDPLLWWAQQCGVGSPLREGMM